MTASEILTPIKTSWYSNPDNAIEFSKLMARPVVQRGLQVLIEQGVLARTPQSGESAVSQNALMNAYREGYFDFYRNVVMLGIVDGGSTPKPGNGKDLPKQFEGYDDEAAIRKSRSH